MTDFSGGFQQWLRGIDGEWILQKVCMMLAGILAITVHESAHALSAHWLGDDTAKQLKRISMNPLRHIDPVGLVMIVIAGFGWAKPVPVDMRRFKNQKLGMALTSLAGPAANVLLALLAAAFYPAACFKYVASGGFVSRALFYLCYSLLMINAGLAVFNLIPVPPLDGSKILAIFLPDKAHEWLMRYERYGFVLLIVLLFTGVLDKPLDFLRGGLINGLSLITQPLANLLAKILL